MVLGLGNLIMSDDGLGIRAIQALQADPRTPAEAALVDGGTCGLALLSYVAEATHLLVLDAVDVEQPAGILVRLAGDRLARLPADGTAHERGLGDLLAAARLLGHEPEETVLLGLQPGIIASGDRLSAPVGGSLGRLVEAALQQLREWAEE